MSVFPTPVGVFPNNGFKKKLKRGLPHARGGVSWRPNFTGISKQSSPRPWGCFQVEDLYRPIKIVFPTPVGVFL